MQGMSDLNSDEECFTRSHYEESRSWSETEIREDSSFRSDEDSDENHPAEITESDLECLAILVDAQTLFGAGSVDFLAAVNQVVEIALLPVAHPLSSRYVEEKTRKSVVYQPLLGKSSSMAFRVSHECSHLRGSLIHGIFPFRATSRCSRLVTYSREVFEKAKAQCRGNSEYLFVNDRWDHCHYEEMRLYFRRLGSQRLAFLTMKSRVEEVKVALKFLQDIGIPLDHHRLFEYEEVAGGPKFFTINRSDDCVFHRQLEGDLHCCTSTVVGMSRALVEAGKHLAAAALPQ